MSEWSWARRQGARAWTTLYALQQRVAALEAALARLQIAWDAMCRCDDEFIPEYPEVCLEYQGRLDSAIRDVLATRAGADAGEGRADL